MQVKLVKAPNQSKSFEDFCSVANTITKFTGFDFMELTQSSWLKYLMKYFFTMACLSQAYVLFFIGKEVYSMLMDGMPDLSLFLRLISGFNYSISATAKCINYFWHIRENKKIYKTFKQIFPKSPAVLRQYNVVEYYWPKWMKTIFLFYFGATALISISPLLETAVLFGIDLANVGVEDAKSAYLRLYEIPYLFDHQNPIAYIVTYAIEIMHAIFVITFNIGVDIWLLCYILQLCMHFDYISGLLDAYEPNDKEPEKDQRFLEFLIPKHQIVLELCSDLNSTFGLHLLLLLTSITATICCAGIYTITQGVGKEFLEYVAFLPTAIGQYYLICYYSQQLTIMSSKVADAAYNHPWYNGSNSYKKSILIILIRAQKEVELNAIGLQPICLEAFKLVMGTTYRVFALLRTMLE